MDEKKDDQPRVVIRKMHADASEKKPFEHVIHFEMRSEVDGKDYIGQFVYKKLRLGDYGKIAALRLRLNGGNPDDLMDQITYSINNAIAHCIVWFEDQQDKPAWAKDLTKLMDAQIVLLLHKEGISFENSFRESMDKRSGEASTGSLSAIK